MFRHISSLFSRDLIASITISAAQPTASSWLARL
jgi:hypothetical protein